MSAEHDRKRIAARQDIGMGANHYLASRSYLKADLRRAKLQRIRWRMTNEEWYDAEIAPELMRLGKLCEARGMSFLCQVEYAPGDTSETKAVVADHGIKTVIARMGMECHGNVDSLIWGIKRYAAKHGHQSAELHLMGIPPTPPQSDADSKP